MELGISEDFTTDVVFDAELTGVSSTGLTLNSGVHPSLTLANLLAFLPFPEITIEDYDDATTYGEYSVTRKRSDLVLSGGEIFQSLKSENLNNTPDPEGDTDFWLRTNLESLKLKSFISKVKDRVYSDLNLIKRLVNSQYLYEVGEHINMLPNQYCAYVFEPKGSDYLTFKINQIAFQGTGTDPVNLYVVNEGTLIETLQITPNNGALEFNDLNYTFSGKGKWYFVIDSQEVKTNQGVVDVLKYDGFVCYTASGNGGAPNDVEWGYQTVGNGLGFNISVTLDSSVYINNNISNLGGFIRSTFELMALQMFLHNSSNRSNADEIMQRDRELLMMETKALDADTVARQRLKELEKAKRAIEKTFDTQLGLDDDDFNVEITSV